MDVSHPPPLRGISDDINNILDEYLQEVAGMPDTGGGHTAGSLSPRQVSFAPEGQQDAQHQFSEQAGPSRVFRPSTQARTGPGRPFTLQHHQDADWTPSSDSDNLSTRAKKASPKKKGRDRRHARQSARRTQELQEKNRQAQQRFRARQREKVTELEDHVVDLNRRIAALMTDNTQLERRVDELSASQRDSQSGPAISGSGVKSSSEISAVDVKRDCPEGCTLDDTGSQEPTVLTVDPNNHITMTPEQIKGLTQPDLIALWKDYRMELMRLVHDMDTNQDAGPQDHGRVKQLVYELMVLLIRVGVHNPIVTKAFVAGNMEGKGAEELEDMKRWRDIMVLLQLSVEQKQQMIELRQCFLAKLKEILDRRRVIHADITASLPEAYSARHAAKQFLRSHRNMDLLKKNMQEEQVLKLDWISAVINQIWTPLQTARSMVLSWPYTPDTFAIGSWVAAEQGDTSAMLVCTPQSPKDGGAEPDEGLQVQRSAPALSAVQESTVQNTLEAAQSDSAVVLKAPPGRPGSGANSSHGSGTGQQQHFSLSDEFPQHRHMTSTPFSANMGPMSATPMDATAKVDESTILSTGGFSAQELSYMDIIPLPRDVFPPLLEQSTLLDPSMSHPEGTRAFAYFGVEFVLGSF
ncbi:hypothetical protein WJX73_006874 [Symbiochloris irregularis]|uniref:BZIP domain-containing protein n=1 Tax=Symbiochloris irregularis TaxID=706552 RepID=A0AAW1PIF1_9CHLO